MYQTNHQWPFCIPVQSLKSFTLPIKLWAIRLKTLDFRWANNVWTVNGVWWSVGKRWTKNRPWTERELTRKVGLYNTQWMQEKRFVQNTCNSGIIQKLQLNKKKVKYWVLFTEFKKNMGFVFSLKLRSYPGLSMTLNRLQTLLSYKKHT